jgi:eukaryotic-like serine/threonine-protein kinase
VPVCSNDRRFELPEIGLSDIKKLGKFEILSKLGQGAMGVVYKAKDPLINRIVALKTMKAGVFEDSVLLKRFYSEARSAGSLRHPNIVTIYELGHEGDVPFIAMQFLSGESLDKVIDRLPNLPLSQRVGFIVHTCRALDYAHKQNPPVVHRDIKPANVVVGSDGSVVVVDFGIARLGETSMSLSSGLLIGTLGYMSPQLFQGGTATAQSDIWAAGVMFYELLAYRRPFRGENAAALMSNVVLEEPRPISEAAPGTPEDVEKVLSRMLAKNVEERYQSMEEVLSDLEPVWKRLLQADISILLENSERLLNEGDLLAAKSEIVQILNWDSTNARARRVSDLINAELRKQKLVPQVRIHVENAQKLLAEGHNEEARSEAQLALKLDSSYQPAAEILQQAQTALERARKIRQALHASEELLAEGSLTEAETQLDRALALDPCNEDARNHLKQVRDERAQRELRKQRESLLQRARSLWANTQYEDCVNLLTSLDKQFPNDPEIPKFLDAARQDQIEHRRQSLLVEIRNLLGAGHFSEALTALEAFFAEFPSDTTGDSLQSQALHGRDLQERDKRIQEGKTQLRGLLNAKNYEETVALGKTLQREFPWDSELADLLISARTEQFQVQQKLRFEQLTARIAEMIEGTRIEEAIQTAEAALAEFPDSKEILSLAERARQEQAERGRQQLVKHRVHEVERMIAQRHLTDAIELARQTITTLGHNSKLQGVLQQAEKELELREKKKQLQSDTVRNAHSLLNDNKLTEAALLLKGAIETRIFAAEDPRVKALFEEIGARRRAPTDPGAGGEAKVPLVASEVTLVQAMPDASRDSASDAGAAALHAQSDPTARSMSGSPSDIQANTGVKEYVDLKAIEKHLAVSIGPMARFLIERAAATARTPDELFAQIAAMMRSEQERGVFLSKKQQFLRVPPLEVQKARAVAAGAEQFAGVRVSQDNLQLNAETIGKASELTARYLGPVSRILAVRAAKRTDSLQGLYLILADYLKDKGERAEFLREAGFPQA